MPAEAEQNLLSLADLWSPHSPATGLAGPADLWSPHSPATDLAGPAEYSGAGGIVVSAAALRSAGTGLLRDQAYPRRSTTR
ncbi:hypothetical protein PoB_000613900 [Plakobranchus ocellatus]|uniref:Uncharacterized protein n=1 Tax=Plakobranchus ocellatus TaxID=259542 RepID=A0AAV3Y9J3_9GAST|nr:hypothetical protein PoB_000613900 [Plakobranchus ocellatus]